MNNSFQNAINNQKKYHVRVFYSDKREETIFDAKVSGGEYAICMELPNNSYKDIEYDFITRIEIHACQFPYKENTPFLYLFLK